jgi:hypothetical protein
MVARSALSARELMRLVVLAALNLALFQGAWMLVLFPPITLLFAILNVTIYHVWVRRRRLSRPLTTSLFVGLAMSVMLFIVIPPVILVFPRTFTWRDLAAVDLFGFASMLCAGWLAALRERRRRRTGSLSVGRRS